MIIRWVLVYVLSFVYLVSSPVSNLSGELNVENGVATYSIPLALPKGVADVEPKLSLVYNSNGANGYLGVGWSINGASSAITRCSQNKLQDGRNHKFGIKYNEDDRFCMDGQRLVAIDTEYGEDGTEYKTSIDNYSKIISHGTYGGGGPNWFEVRGKDGTIYKYGYMVEIAEAKVHI
jgi:hypothetical protein